jgi:hypothetical protein
LFAANDNGKNPDAGLGAKLKNIVRAVDDRVDRLLMDKKDFRKSRLERLTRAFNAAAEAGYAESRKEAYLSRGLIDLTELHLKRAVAAAYRHDYEDGRVPVLAAPAITGKLNADKDKSKADIIAGIDALPPGTKQLFAEFNLRTWLARRLVNVSQSYAARIAAFDKEGLTNDFNIAAYYFHREIILLQECRDRREKDKKIYIKNPLIAHNFLHESGHALDDLLHYFSESAAFTDAYAADLENAAKPEIQIVETATERLIRPAPIKSTAKSARNCKSGTLTRLRTSRSRFRLAVERNARNTSLLDPVIVSGLRLGYYLDKEHNGKHAARKTAQSEACAELFAACAGNGNQNLTYVFEKTTTLMEQVLASVAYEMETPLPTLAALRHP